MFLIMIGALKGQNHEIKKLVILMGGCNSLINNITRWAK